MKYHKIENETDGGLELAKSLCAQLGAKFTPNFSISLRWPAPVFRRRAESDVRMCFSMFNSIVGRRTLLVDGCPDRIDRISASQRKQTLDECLVWGRYDDELVDQTLLNNLPVLWECMVGGSSELVANTDGAFESLVSACEKQSGSLVFSAFSGDDEDEDDWG